MSEGNSKEPMNELEKELAADEAALAKLAGLGPEDKPEEEVIVEDAEEDEPVPKDEPEPKPEVDADKEDKNLTPSVAAFAKERCEKRALAAQKAALEAQLAELRKAPAEQPKKEAVVSEVKKDEVSADPEPNKLDNYEEWLEWKDRQSAKLALEATKIARETADQVKEINDWRESQRKAAEYSNIVSAAVQEFTQIENDYRAKNPDYGNAMEYGRREYGRALKLLNPQLTEKQVEQELDKQMLMFAAEAKARGLNPAEELYDTAIERFGYQPNQGGSQTEVAAKPVAKRPSLSVIQANKKRSASPLSGGGQGGSASITAADLENMTNAEFSRLSAAQLRALEQAS